MNAPELSFLAAAYVQRNRRWLLLGLLVLLHLALMQGPLTSIGRTLFLVHLGLFILWQPFVRAEKQLTPLQQVLVPCLAGAAAYWLNAWFLITWIMTLAGVVGGKVFLTRARGVRLFYLCAFGYLLLILLGWVVPEALSAGQPLHDGLLALMSYGVPWAFVAMAVMPVRGEQAASADVIDFIYSVFLFLLVAVLVSGAVALTVVLERSYIEALLYTLAGIAAVLLVLGWTWNPRAGFVGIGTLVSRYQLSVGFPFERWLHELAERSRVQDDPHGFLVDAFSGMEKLPGVVGGRWEAGGRSGAFGSHDGPCTDFFHPSVKATLYSSEAIGPSLRWHFDLLVQVLGEFYVAKVRGQRLQQMSYVQAVHETGARLTHDVKNLLQSLNTLCSVNLADSDEAEFRALVGRQLPTIAQRLAHTLDKLQRPAAENPGGMSAAAWWADAQKRYAHRGIRFTALGAESDAPLPASLYSSALENLLQNALEKRAAQRNLSVTVMLDFVDLSLTVQDNGSPVPADVAAALFQGPVRSETGLGIGLYQLAQQARLLGYGLRLSGNTRGDVCFRLAAEPGPSPGGALAGLAGGGEVAPRTLAS